MTKVCQKAAAPLKAELVCSLDHELSDGYELCELCFAVLTVMSNIEISGAVLI